MICECKYLLAFKFKIKEYLVFINKNKNDLFVNPKKRSFIDFKNA